MWRPCIIQNKLTGQRVHVTIFDRQLYLSGFGSFDDLVEMYGDSNILIENVGGAV